MSHQPYKNSIISLITPIKHLHHSCYKLWHLLLNIISHNGVELKVQCCSFEVLSSASNHNNRRRIKTTLMADHQAKALEVQGNLSRSKGQLTEAYEQWLFTNNYSQQFSQKGKEA